MTAIQLAWHDSQETILHYTFPNIWQWDDFYAVKAEADPLLLAKPYSVALVMDLTQSKGIPAHPIRQIRSLLHKRVDKGSPIIFVGKRYLFKSLFRVIKQMCRRVAPDLYLVDTLDDALKLVAVH